MKTCKNSLILLLLASVNNPLAAMDDAESALDEAALDGPIKCEAKDCSRIYTRTETKRFLNTGESDIQVRVGFRPKNIEPYDVKDPTHSISRRDLVGISKDPLPLKLNKEQTAELLNGSLYNVFVYGINPNKKQEEKQEGDDDLIDSFRFEVPDQFRNMECMPKKKATTPNKKDSPRKKSDIIKISSPKQNNDARDVPYKESSIIDSLMRSSSDSEFD